MQFTIDDIILYPTDTIYGLGVDATNPEMVRKLKELKGRGDDKYISIAVSGFAMMRAYAVMTPLAEELARAFLPGKLTLVMRAKPEFCIEGVVGKDGSVGVRIPAYARILEIIQAFGKPITATSANVSGKSPEDTPEKIFKQFGDTASWITKVITAGALPPSEPSTVVDARGEKPIILRSGAIDISNNKWIKEGI